MPEIHDNIIALLKENGIDYREEHGGKLAKGILNIVRNTTAQHLSSIVFTKEKMRKGTHCPVCSQNVKMHKKRIDGNMAKCLIKLYHLSHGDTSKYFHVQHDLGLEQNIGGSWAKLRYWELIEEKPKDNGTTNKRTSGSWRITTRGIDFVRGRISVEKYARLYNMSLYGFEGDGVTITEALGTKFNYQELMSR